MRTTIIAAVLAVMGFALPASAQTEWKTTCFCQFASDAKRYFFEITLNDENRASVRKALDSKQLDSGKTAKVTGSGCPKSPTRNDCGQAFVTVTKSDGTTERKQADNTPITGTKTLRLTAIHNIPTKRGADGKSVIDDEAWAKARMIVVNGTEQ
jgi:hypothetical protein